MTALLATPTPYLRDGLRRLVAGLRKDAETVHLNLAEAEQDVAAARALLAEAEAQRQRAKDAADALDAEIAFFEREAERTPPAYDPDAALAATGLMPRTKDEPKPPADAPTCAICGEPLAPDGGGWLHWHGPRDHPATPEDLPFNVVQAPADVIAAITGGTRVITDEPPRTDTVHTSGTGAGVIVATGGPTVTMPDTGLNPPPLPPADVTAEARHARPKGSRLTGPLKALISKDGDA